MGKLSRDKGARVEREIVNLHRRIGVTAERVPLSGAQRYQNNGEDVDIYPWGIGDGPLCCQVKALGSESGTKMLLGWLGDADGLFLRYDADPGRPARPPLVVLTWESYERLLRTAKQKSPSPLIG